MFPNNMLENCWLGVGLLAGLDWAGLAWAGLGCAVLGKAGLGWAGLGWARLAGWLDDRRPQIERDRIED